MQRRKKKSPEQGSEPAPPPLQPAYFESGEAPESGQEQPEARETPEVREAPQSSEGASSAGAETAEPAGQPSSGDSRRGRTRRRRGGRGRGGRGREQAVAQAFTPAAVKGVIPDVSAEVPEESVPQAAEERDGAGCIAGGSAGRNGCSCGGAASSKGYRGAGDRAAGIGKEFLVQAA